MSACAPFSIPFNAPAGEYLEKAKAAIAKMNGTLTGDETQGSFDVNSPIGKVSGTYSVNGQTLTITITDKPMMLACGMIEGLMKGALS